MNKRRYKSVEFKKVDWNKVGDRIEGERVVLAVDVAKEDFVATLLDAEQTTLVTFKWRHPQDTAEVVERMASLGQALQLEAVMEFSGTYGDALVWQLRQAGIALYPPMSKAGIKVLKDDPKEILRAARDAEQINRYVMALEKDRALPEQGVKQSTNIDRPEPEKVTQRVASRGR